MKNRIITSLLFLLCATGFAQDFNYLPAAGTAGDLYFEVRGTYTNTIKREKLNAAKTMLDINPGYATSWITDYISAEIIATCSGKVMRAMSTNGFLTLEQRSILNKAEMSTDITIDVKYRYKNSVTGNMDMRGMLFTVTVVPETQAEYSGGYAQMKTYLKETAINKISKADYNKLQATVRFTVNEEGVITVAQISKTSGNKETDKLLVDAIYKMPKWIPAADAKGIKVKQEFLFNVGNGGC